MNRAAHPCNPKRGAPFGVDWTARFVVNRARRLPGRLSVTQLQESGLGEFDEHLAGVISAEYADQGAGRVLEAFDDLLAVFQFAFLEPLRDLRDCLLSK